MKKILLFLLIGTMSLALKAQTASLDHFYETYKYGKEVVNLSLPGFLIRFGASIAQMGAEDEMEYLSMELLKDVKKVKILTGEGLHVRPSDLVDLLDDLEAEGFEELMTVHSDDTDFRFIIRERKDFIRNIVIIAEEDSDFTLLSLKTKMYLEDLSAVINESMQN